MFRIAPCIEALVATVAEGVEVVLGHVLVVEFGVLEQKEIDVYIVALTMYNLFSILFPISVHLKFFLNKLKSIKHSLTIVELGYNELNGTT